MYARFNQLIRPYVVVTHKYTSANGTEREQNWDSRDSYSETKTTRLSIENLAITLFLSFPCTLSLSLILF